MDKKEQKTVKKAPFKKPAGAATASAAGAGQERKRTDKRGPRRPDQRRERQDDFEQRIVDLARVTRVMAGGKRMRFRACVAIGDRKGKVAVGLAKGADVTMAIAKAVTNAKKELIDVPFVNDTIPHQVMCKVGAAEVLIKPAAKGRGVIAGGAARIILELAGVRNITSKILGTNNKINVSRCTIEALRQLKKREIAPAKPKAEAPVEKPAEDKK